MPADTNRTGLTILNFSHPLTPAQLQQIEELAGQPVESVISVSVQLQNGEPFEMQMRRLVDHIDPAGQVWHTREVLINPPGHAPATAVLLAELHGRMGHFPAILRLRPRAGSTPTRYEVAEIVNLQSIRDSARVRRSHATRD